MTAQHLIQTDENDEEISVWREANGRFTISDKYKGNPQTVELSPDLAEEIANAILKSILVNGR